MRNLEIGAMTNNAARKIFNCRTLTTSLVIVVYVKGDSLATNMA